MACGGCNRTRGPVKVARDKSGVTVIRQQKFVPKKKLSKPVIKAQIVKRRRVGVKRGRA